MKLKTMKRSILMLAAAFVMSSGAMAENMQGSKALPLSDAELDNITAGSVFLTIGISNPGKADVSKFNGRHFHCVNCAEMGGGSDTTRGVVAVWKPGTSPLTGDLPHVMHSIGKPVVGSAF